MTTTSTFTLNALLPTEFLKLLREHRGDTRGSVLPLVAFAIFALVIATGVAVDMSREQTVRAKLDAAIDAATIAAAKSVQHEFTCSNDDTATGLDACINTQINTVGTTYFNANFANSWLSGTVIPSFTYDGSTGTVIGTVSGNMPTTFMQVAGQTSFPVSGNAVTQASIFYLGQNPTGLNPTAWSDPTTGFYATATLNPSAWNANATGSAGNSLIETVNGFNAMTIGPSTLETEWPANDFRGTDVFLGNAFGGSYLSAEYGPALHFGGKTGNNSDDIYFQRYNVSGNQTAFLLNLSDDYGGQYMNGQSGDAFFIEATRCCSGGPLPLFQFTTDGQMWITNTLTNGANKPGATLHFGSSSLSGDGSIENSDDMFIERWDIADDRTALFVNLGDNYKSPLSAAGDAFIIGAEDSGNGDDYHTLFTFSSSGHLLIGDTDSNNFSNTNLPEAITALTLSGGSGGTTNSAAPLGWDSVLSSRDPLTGGGTHLIGTYNGWNNLAVYIAGYNASMPGGYFANAVNVGGEGSTAVLIDLVNNSSTGNSALSATSTGGQIPNSTLDVRGEVKVGSTGVRCSAINEGAMQYTPATSSASGFMSVCQGTTVSSATTYAWTPIGGSPGTTVWFTYGGGGFSGVGSLCSYGNFSSNGSYCTGTISFSSATPSFQPPDNNYELICSVTDLGDSIPPTTFVVIMTHSTGSFNYALQNLYTNYDNAPANQRLECVYYHPPAAAGGGSGGPGGGNPPPNCACDGPHFQTCTSPAGVTCTGSGPPEDVRGSITTGTWTCSTSTPNVSPSGTCSCGGLTGSSTGC